MLQPAHEKPGKKNSWEATPYRLLASIEKTGGKCFFLFYFTWG